jgi:hypothetical protein
MYCGYRTDFVLPVHVRNTEMKKRAVKGVHLPEMRNVVELSYDRVQMIRPNVAVLTVHLRAEMSEYDHGRLIGSEEDRPDEQLEMLKALIVVVRIQFQNHHVRKVRYVMGGAKAKVP